MPHCEYDIEYCFTGIDPRAYLLIEHIKKAKVDPNLKPWERQCLSGYLDGWKKEANNAE